MIQDISPAVFHNEYLPAAPAEGDGLFVFQGQKVLVHPEENRFPLVSKDLEASDLPVMPNHFAERDCPVGLDCLGASTCSVGSDCPGAPIRSEGSVCLEASVRPEESECHAAPELLPGEKLRYLFRMDERSYYLYLMDVPTTVDASAGDAPQDAHQKSDGALLDHLLSRGFTWRKLSEIRQGFDAVERFACMTAFHLFTWYDKHRRCGRCGAPLEHGAKERMLRCPECGNMVFPVIAPAVIVGVTDGERLLMTKYAGREYTGWALIAGFCEIGESLTDTVRREVMEEAGLQVRNLRYVASQPWGSDSNLLMGIFCEVDGSTDIQMDGEELSRALWVHRRDVPEMKDNQSLTGYMIELFRTGKEAPMPG